MTDRNRAGLLICLLMLFFNLIIVPAWINYHQVIIKEEVYESANLYDKLWSKADRQALLEDKLNYFEASYPDDIITADASNYPQGSGTVDGTNSEYYVIWIYRTYATFNYSEAGISLSIILDTLFLPLLVSPLTIFSKESINYAEEKRKTLFYGSSGLYLPVQRRDR